MKKIYLNNQLTIVPSIEEWYEIIRGSICNIKGIEIINNKIFREQVELCINKNVLNTSRTLGVLDERKCANKCQWWPSIIYWSEGCPQIEDNFISSLEDMLFFRVYFHMFHCFQCGLDIAGYALDRDAYIFRENELNKVYDSFDFFSLRCLDCEGSMRNPGLVEIIQIHKR